jgi:hypothetical protein
MPGADYAHGLKLDGDPVAGEIVRLAREGMAHRRTQQLGVRTPRLLKAPQRRVPMER